MKKNIISVLLVIVVISIGFLLFNNLSSKKQADNGSSDTGKTKYVLKEQGLVFEYEKGEDGYTLEEQSANSSIHPQFVRSLTITPTKDYLDQQNREGGEGSPSLSLFVYNNNLKQSPSVWVDRNPEVSNIKLIMGETKEDVVAGANAVSYIIDGLYPTKVTVIANGEFIFVASGSYLDENSKTKNDFEPWLSSFEFIPAESNTASQVKIDPKVACESALAYMSFSSGAEADAFVSDCINGKHPEVIQRYISDMGLDGKAI